VTLDTVLHSLKYQFRWFELRSVLTKLVIVINEVRSLLVHLSPHTIVI